MPDAALTEYSLSSSSGETLQRAEALIVSNPSAAAMALRRLLEVDPLNARAYRLLAQATESSLGVVTSSAAEPLLMQAARALQSGDLETAEIILRRRLRAKPSDVTALHMLADFAIRLYYLDEAEDLLRLALEHEPQSAPVKLSLAALLHRRNRAGDAVALLEEVLADFPQHLAAWNLQAAAFARSGQRERAEQAYRESLRLEPRQPRTWAHYGNLLKTMGRSDDCLFAFRQAIEIGPTVGLGWWSLADLKTFRFDKSHIRRMQDALAREDLGEEDEVQIEFALGRAFEQAGDAAASFEHYVAGNRKRRAQEDYDPERLTAYVDDATRIFTPDFFENRAGNGWDAPGVIFIIGLTRSGSTLIEQILASHEMVEGTFELPTLPEIVNAISPQHPGYATTIESLSAEQISAIGQQYMLGTRVYRKTQRPFFVDKMPINWRHVPLIQLALPNAKIIDARRHPLDCCLSNFKQLYLAGQSYTYDLEDLGRYYSDYVRFMSHIDTVLPGRVYRLFHERLIEDTETEVQRLLDHLGLPFDEACLRFWETDRAVQTASAAQVRRPIGRQGMGSWRKFEPWLGPLKAALGSVLTAYPNVPEFDTRTRLV